MKEAVYKTYELEEVLSLYINRNGILSKYTGPRNENGNNVFEPFIEEENIDKQIEKDLLEDVDVPENESVEMRIKRIKRYQRIVKLLKQKFNYKCQLCGYTFPMDNENGYCEAHHISMLSKDGSQSPENVIILCANHHRMFHYAMSAIKIGNLYKGKRIIEIGNEEFIVPFC